MTLETSSRNSNLVFFLLAICLVAVSGGVYDTTFNNYISDTFHLGADARGYLEFPRELPGFLTALFAGALFFLPETKIAAAAAVAIGLGTLGLAWSGTDWNTTLFFITIWSIGTHLSMPVRSSLSMGLAEGGQKGRRLGQVQGAGIAAAMIGCTFVLVGMKYLHLGYRAIFTVAGLAALAGGFFFLFMRMPGAHLDRPKFVFRKQYWLYYALSFLFGARKQIFLTFGPWVLVKIYHQPAYIFAQLYIVASIAGIAFQPLLGRAIDRFGERPVLMIDAVLIALVCAGYGFANHFAEPRLALWILYACYIADLLLFGTGMARDTYLAKIALKPEHIAPSLSLGISINHAVSMSIPAVGGLMWMKYGYSSVFAAAAGIAVIMLGFSSMIRLPGGASLPAPLAPVDEL